ncbi:FUSC family protein [Gallaecimonas mangrovi]|uniref:FUSC family protein n=1 Tax=Gallaecimonas mangrovi TaxID=2291597 RepID=UPI000E205382|nr:FUSC family protein [Gallaecimonas mangrovi]
MTTEVRQWLPSLDDWRQAFTAWARTDGVNWIYLFKLVLAASLTLSLAMALQMQRPSTAMITVFVVMQPQSGQVIAKGMARLVGTVIGLSVMVVLVSLFAQQRWLFLGAMALWIGFCLTGASRYRDMRFYAFVLSGYTAALIGLPATIHPETAVMQAIWRVLEISLAIFTTTLVSVLVFPQSTNAALRSAIGSRFGRFAGFVIAHLDGKDAGVLRKINVEFAAQAVGLENMRSASAVEDPNTRLRNRRLIHLNNDFLGLLTRFNGLHRQLNRLHEHELEMVIAALAPALESVKAELAPWPDQSMNAKEAGDMAEKLEAFLPQLMQCIREARQQFVAQYSEHAMLLEFNTTAELLFQFCAGLQGYMRSHHALANPHHHSESLPGDFASKTNLLASLVAGGRVALAIFLGGAIWFALDWKAGPYLLANVAAISCLASGMPNPSKMAVQMAIGTLLGGIFGVLESVYVFPMIDGLPLLLMATLPVILLGGWLTLNPARMGIGLGLMVMFTMGSIPNNPAVYDPLSVISNYTGLFLGSVLTAVIASVILPPASGWMWWTLERELRNTLSMVSEDDLDGLSGRFESRCRDVLSQAYGLSARRPDIQTELVQWSLIVQEVGHAMINWRQELKQMNAADAKAWGPELRQLSERLTALFANPSMAALTQAQDQVHDMILRIHGHLDEQDHFDRSSLRRTLSFLHFVRTTLLDRYSILQRKCLKGAEDVRH